MPLTWTKSSPYHWQSEAGHTVCAAKTPEGWRYTAWGPDRAPEGWQYRAWANGTMDHWAGQDGARVTYPVGHTIPQRHPMLGTRGTAAEARALCEVDHD